MNEPDEHGRVEAEPSVGEAETILGFLDFQRATFAWKCSGLDAAGLSATHAPSAMTLGGLMKHLALNEDGWFTRTFAGGSYPEPWDAIDWDADPDWEWRTGASDPPAELRALWESCADRSRAVVRAALEVGGLDQPASRPFSDGRHPSLRWVVCHLIEEYARHNGHADLIRESIDGLTGE